MKSLLLSLILAVAVVFAQAQPQVIDLWPNGAPNDNGLTGPETQLENGRIGNVSHPTLTVYLPKHPNGQALIACPGGGYIRLAPNHEGHDMAPWMNNLGVTFCVLKYRMPNGNLEVPISDVLQAIRIVREHAQEWQLDPHQIGIMGASAGGNLATQAATVYTGPEDRPDFQVLFYPYVEVPEVPAPGKPKRGDEYNTVNKVNAQTPPAFVMCSADDRSVPFMNSIHYFEALTQNGVPCALHIYPTGGHGWGYLDTFPYKREWTGELERWLSNLLKK